MPDAPQSEVTATPASPLRLTIAGASGAGTSALVSCLRAARCRRPLVIADAPDGETHLDDLVAAAATADAGLLVVEASDGLTAAVRRQLLQLSALGVPQLVVVVNKMDGVGWAQTPFDRVAAEARALVDELGLSAAIVVPTAAAADENVTSRTGRAPWYQGPTLVAALEALSAADDPGSEEEARTGTDVADAFEATIVWTEAAPLLPGRTYLLRTATATVTASVVRLKYKTNPANLQRLAATTLVRGDVGVGNLKLERRIAFASDRGRRHASGFILLDQVSGRTAGAGRWHFALRRAENVHWQTLDVDKTARAVLKGQRPCVLWYTGLSGAGKSTIANLVDRRLHDLGRHTYLLDGENVRHGLNKDLGFTDADRVENIRRIGEVAKLMVDAGLIVGTAFISPFRAERGMARALLAEGEFIEVHIDTPLAVAEQRDPKGLYRKARRGVLKNFTGIDSPYEAPQHPDIRVDTTVTTADEAAEQIVALLRERGFLGI